MARVAEILEDLLDLPMTLAAIDVLEGIVPPMRSLADRTTLKAVSGGAIAVPCGNTARQDALNGASV